MNEEQLWLAIGSAEDRYIIATESFERKKAKGLHLLLAAAIILALSVSAAAAVRYRTGIKDIWEKDALSDGTVSALESGTVNIGGSVAKSAMEASVTEALADERNLYLVWQLESYGDPFPDGTTQNTDLDFGDVTVDSGMGYSGGRIATESDNILCGYVVTDWNEIMQSTGGTLTISNIEAPQEVLSGEEYIPNWSELFEKCEYVDFPEIKYIKGSLWPREYFPQYGGLEIEIGDSGCNILDFACYEDGWLYVTVKEPETVLVNGKSRWIYKFADENGAEILPTYTLVAKEGGVPSTTYYIFAFEIEREAAESMKFIKRGGTVYKSVTEESFCIEFFVSEKLESVDLDCIEGVNISCSPISMSIDGIGEQDAMIEITDKSGNRVNVISYAPDNIVFEKPIVPEELASVKLDGKELLQP